MSGTDGNLAIDAAVFLDGHVRRNRMVQAAWAPYATALYPRIKENNDEQPHRE
jgi:hypothetical protein